MNPSWKNHLVKDLNNAQRVCIIGVGNKDKGDDAAGVFCTEILAVRLKHIPGIKVINAEEVPENHTGKIRKFKPTHTIIIDSTIAGKKPGTVFLVDTKKIADTDVSTHRMSLSMFVRFMEESIPSKAIMIGIEPESIELHEPVSQPVQQAITEVVESLAGFFSSFKPRK